jgi:hypothetical protein
MSSVLGRTGVVEILVSHSAETLKKAVAAFS